jgi:hypothetical protein
VVRHAPERIGGTFGRWAHRSIASYQRQIAGYKFTFQF